jgi:ribonuclease BN (tRNA processing enzyme)
MGKTVHTRFLSIAMASAAIASLALVAALPIHAAKAQAVAPGAVNTPAKPPADTTVLTLLGTQGGPGVTVQRAGESNLLTIRGKYYLIDAGIGVSRRLAEAGVPLASISKIFITHQHNDHTAGLFGLMTLYSSRTGQLEIMGPPKTAEFVADAIPLMKINWDIRAEQGGLPVARMMAMFKGRDVRPGLVYSDDNVKVTAIENAHFHFKPGSIASPNKSYSYRFQTPHKVIAFTGDTGADPKLAKFFEGADILVCEMVSPAVIKNVAEAGRYHMIEEHLSPTQVGQLARDAKVKKLVLSHVVGAAPEDIAEIKKWYSGEVVIGADLQKFE